MYLIKKHISQFIQKKIILGYKKLKKNNNLPIFNIINDELTTFIFPIKIKKNNYFF